YRLFWRRRIDPTGVRSLQAAIFPPGAGHVDQVNSVAANSLEYLIDLAGSASTLISDFLVRSTVSSDVYVDTIQKLPAVSHGHALVSELRYRTLLLNGAHPAFGELWQWYFAESPRSKLSADMHS